MAQIRGWQRELLLENGERQKRSSFLLLPSKLSPSLHPPTHHIYLQSILCKVQRADGAHELCLNGYRLPAAQFTPGPVVEVRFVLVFHLAELISDSFYPSNTSSAKKWFNFAPARQNVSLLSRLRSVDPLAPLVLTYWRSALTELVADSAWNATEE